MKWQGGLSLPSSFSHLWICAILFHCGGKIRLFPEGPIHKTIDRQEELCLPRSIVLFLSLIWRWVAANAYLFWGGTRQDSIHKEGVFLLPKGVAICVSSGPAARSQYVILGCVGSRLKELSDFKPVQRASAKVSTPEIGSWPFGAHGDSHVLLKTRNMRRTKAPFSQIHIRTHSHALTSQRHRGSLSVVVSAHESIQHRYQKENAPNISWPHPWGGGG